MNSHADSLSRAICLAALIVGCGGGEAPTDPGPARTTLTIEFGSIEVLEDCDGIEGDGDFSFLVSVGDGKKTEDVYDQNVNLPSGGKTAVLGRRPYTVDAIDGATVTVYFNALELDKNILGTEYNDERLAIATSKYSHVFSEGAWSGLGRKTLSLGSEGCRVRLSWSAAA